MNLSSSAARTLAVVAAAPTLVGAGAYVMQEASARHRIHDADAFTSEIGGRFLGGAALLGVGLLVGVATALHTRPPLAIAGLGVLAGAAAYGIGAVAGEASGARVR